MKIQIQVHKTAFTLKQECIPMGCVPTAPVAIWGEGSARGGGCLPSGGIFPGECTPPPPPRGQTDTCKNLCATTVADGNNMMEFYVC